MYSDLNDTSINFKSIDYDIVNRQYLIGGNNSFVGVFDKANNGKIRETATLPSTVILTSDVQSIAANNVDNSIVVRMGNEFARTSDGGASWVDITPAAIVSYQSILSWRSTNLVCSSSGGSIDLYISNDNGLTYPSTKNIFSAAVVASHKNPTETIIIWGCNGGRLFFTKDDDLTTAVYTTHLLTATIGFSGTPLAIGISDDGEKIVCGSEFGDIAVSIDGGNSFTLFDRDTNFFRNSAGLFNAIQTCQYINSIDSFILAGSAVNAIIPADGGLDTMSLAIQIGTTTFNFPGGSNRQIWASDGNDIVIVGNANRTLKFPRV